MLQRVENYFSKKIIMLRVVFSLCLIILVSCNTNTKQELIAQQINTKPNYTIVEVLPKAIFYNTNLELEFIKAANIYQKEFIVSEVLITSSRWSSTFNEAGLVTARSREATIIVYQNENCYLKDVIFEQKRRGDSYHKTHVIESKEWYSFDCNLLETKNPDDEARVKN